MCNFIWMTTRLREIKVHQRTEKKNDSFSPSLELSVYIKKISYDVHNNNKNNNDTYNFLVQIATKM